MTTDQELWPRLRALEKKVARLERHCMLDYGPQFSDDEEATGDIEAPPIGGDQQPEQRQDPLRWGGSREVPHSSRLLSYEGGTG